VSAESGALALARDDQWSRRGEPHVAPLVAFADRLAIARGLPPGVGAVPYPNPNGGGVHARVLLLLNVADGGARIDTGGSGMLTIDNDDRASLRQRKAVRETGLDLATALHWNAIPWFVAEDERPHHVREGARALLERLELLPDLRGVVVLGRWSRKVWAQARGMTSRYRHLAHAQGADPTRTSDVDLMASYRRAVEFAAMP
jgi:hypothetical protein